MNQIIYDNKSYTIYQSDKYNEGKATCEVCYRLSVCIYSTLYI